jgi:hypothetical protein
MQFTGKNLVLVLWALNDACNDVENQIASCPNIYDYLEEIEELEQQVKTYEKLRDRVQATCIKQGLVKESE